MTVTKAKARPHKFNSGDRVTTTSRLYGRKAGTIVRTGRGASVMIHWDGADKDESVRLDSIRPEIAEDVAEIEYKAKLHAWRARRPETRVARVNFNHGLGSNDEMGASARAETPAEMRAAAEDLRALADWFEQRPTNTAH